LRIIGYIPLVPNARDGQLVVCGDIITMDPVRPRAAAVGISEGRVVAVGDRGDAVAACPAGTPVLELPGTVVPGLIDSHVHMLWTGRELDRLDLRGVTSVGEVLDRVRAYARARPGDGWLAGSIDVDAETLAEGRFPTRDELDEAAGGRPLFLDRRSHDAIVNGAALAAAGIDAATPDPSGGVIERAADGTPTGVLIERPAAELAERMLPAPTSADVARWLADVQPIFLAAGVTSVVDPALTPEELGAYVAAADAGELTVRTTAMPLGDGEVDPEAMARRFADAGLDLTRAGDRLRIGPWKLFLDGGGSLGTALLREPWPGRDGYVGNQTTSTDGLYAYARWAARTGAGLGVHCVGGAAIDLALEAFAAADAVAPIAGLGFTLIHAYLWPSLQNMARARDLGVLIATQPPLQWAFGPALVRQLGEEAAGRAHPMRAWLDSGAIVGGGSDGPGSMPVDPLFAFWTMRARTIAEREEPLGADQAITAEEALMLYTTGAATVAGAPDRGRLAPGAVGDLVALDVDPLTASPETCRDGRVLATVSGGRLVHEAG
jgi:predicted amidohydrolase YtcJ